MPRQAKSTWLLLSLCLLALCACGGSRPDYAAENVPPEVAFVAAPPAYTAVASLTLRVTATDTTGVGAVYVLVGSEQVAATLQGDGSWLATVVLPVIGHNILTVWANDKGSPVPNSGKGKGSPYELTADVVYDPTAPAITYDGTFASYADEQIIQLGVDASGIAKVPPVYSVGARVAVPAGGDIYKVWSRLSGGPGMTAAELESTNAGNIPVLRFAAPFSSTTSAPIAAATYAAQVTCSSGCNAAEVATGPLLPSPTAGADALLFDLPVSTETIPALAQVHGTGTIAISVTVTDAAGNGTTSTGLAFHFHVIGPPLVVTEDTAYPSKGTSDSIYGPYHLTDNTYATMWSASASASTNSFLRLKRYLITNPTDQPVALQLSYAQDPSGSWRMAESWPPYKVPDRRGLSSTGAVVLDDPPKSVAFSLDGFNYRNTMYWGLPYGSTGGPVTYAQYGSLPCSSPSTNWLMHRIGDTLTSWLCKSAVGTTSFTVMSGVYSQSDVGVVPFQLVAALDGEERAADTDSTGKWVLVPAAAGSVPGALVVYLARPLSATRTSALFWNTYVTTSSAANHYQTWEYMVWDAYQHGLTTYTLYPGYDSFVANRAGHYLASAADQLFGTFSGVTEGYSASGLVGESTPRFSVSLSNLSLTTH